MIKKHNIVCNHIGGKLMYTFGHMGLKLLNIRDYDFGLK